MSPLQADLASFAEGGYVLPSSESNPAYELMGSGPGFCPSCRRWICDAGIYSVEWRGRVCWSCLQQNARPPKVPSTAPSHSDIAASVIPERPDYSTLPTYEEMKLIPWQEYRPGVLDEARLLIASIDFRDEGISKESIIAALERIVGRPPPLDIVRNSMCAVKAVIAADEAVTA